MHNEDELRRAFGSFMTGVTVVTTADADGTPIGFTANSFTSVSMDPPLLLVCPGKHVASYDVFCTTENFAVTILAEGQEAISNNFASGPEDRFSNVRWHRDKNGCPLIDSACATFSCRVHNRHEAGDHMILVGEITAFSHFDKPGLGYSGNGYFSLGKEQQANTTGSKDITRLTGAIIKYDDQVLVCENDGALSLPVIEQHGRSGARNAMQQLIDSNQLNGELGPVYSIYDDPQTGRHYTFFLVNAVTTQAGELGRFVPIEALKPDQFEDKAMSVMMSRFITEVRNKVFGLYIGDVDAGDVHHNAKDRAE
jgi:flavin reductase (DIM6/NTAB) family NADH-FMN oxidoreductase RutF